MATFTKSCSRAGVCCETHAISSSGRRFRNKLAFFTIREGSRRQEISAEIRAYSADAPNGSCCETRNAEPETVLAGTHLLTNPPQITERNEGLLTKSCFSSGEVIRIKRRTSFNTRICGAKYKLLKKRCVNKPCFAAKYDSSNHGLKDDSGRSIRVA
jgi:hypothetical protein